MKQHEKICEPAIYISIIFFYTIRFACSSFMDDVFLTYLIPTFWLSMFIYVKCHDDFESRLDIGQTGKIFLVLVIIMTSYVLFNAALGLFLGYVRSPYTNTIAINLWSCVFYIFFQEYIKFMLIKRHADKIIVVILIMILFMAIEVQPVSFFDNLNKNDFLNYVSYELIPIILDGLIITYLTKTYDSGYLLSIIYRLILVLYIYLSPFYPNLKDNSDILQKILLISIILFTCENMNENKKISRIYNKKQRKEYNLIFYTIIIPICIALTIFFSGIASYFPVVITSGSMHGNIEIGDIVIVEKIDNSYSVSSIKVGDVVVYKLDNLLVVHRVLNVSKSSQKDEVYYITKGDNNHSPDEDRVLPDQIVGIACCKIPIVGYTTLLARKFLDI